MSDAVNIRDFLESLSLDDLSYVIGRYSGPHNASLSEKKYGFTIPTKLAREIYDRRLVDEMAEKYLLQDETD